MLPGQINSRHKRKIGHTLYFTLILCLCSYPDAPITLEQGKSQTT